MIINSQQALLPTKKMEVNDLHSFLHFVQFPELDALRKVRDSNPRYDVMRTPHFECGSFDHSDNFPTFVSRSSAVPLFTENASKRKRVQRYGFFFKHPNVLHIFCDFSALLGAMRVN